MVVGCGAVGVEFASVFNTFGSEVTLLEALPRVTPLEDEEISAELDKSLRKKGIRIELEAKVESVKKEAQGGVRSPIRTRSGETKTTTAEKVLIAVGRRPLTENIGLEKTKAKVERGFVHTNSFLQTDEPNLYAIGDIVAGIAAAGACRVDGRDHRRGKMSGKPVQPFDRKRCPNATYCEPQIGSIGLDGETGARSGL